MSTFQFGLSKTFPCGYLQGHEERLLIYCDEQPMSAELYAALQNVGFRRSEGMVYKPHCEQCNKCIPIRIPIAHFHPSKSQKRLVNKGKSFSVNITQKLSNEHYELYKRYIAQRHADGAMFPPTEDQLDSFAKCDWLTPYFIEFYHKQQLICVAIGDETANGLSAVYTFFDPDFAKYSLGTLAVLEHINYARQLDKPWLYLGYYINECAKMNYKINFKPYQLLINGQWQEPSLL